MNVITVEQIVKKYLEENEFDGLFNEYSECSCLVGDLAPCGEIGLDCEAGMRTDCPPECGAHNWHVESPVNNGVKQ